MNLYSATASDSPQKPNVVFIFADDAGYGDLSCYGATKFETPNLDKLAAEGMKFTDAHSPSAVCSPSRYSLLTGRYGWRTWTAGDALQSNDPLLIGEDQLTVADVCKQAGYTTGIVGKWHLGFGREGEQNFDSYAGIDWNTEIKPGPLECGFDTFFGIPMVGQLPHLYIRDHKVVGIDSLDKPIEFVGDTRNPDDPLTWWQRYERSTGQYTRREWFEWANTEPIKYEHEDLAVRLTEEAVDYIERQSDEQPFFLYFAHRNPHVPWKPHPQFKGTTEFETEAGQVYGESMVELDWSVGQVLDALERKGLTENTLVIFSSDNGAALYYYPVDYAEKEGHFANGRLRGQKTQVYEGGHRVPFIARWPGKIEPGSVNDTFIANTDFIATIAELLEIEVAEGQAQDSVSYLYTLLGEEPRGEVRNTLILDSPDGLLAVRQGPWVYIPAQGGGGFHWRPYAVDYSKPPGQLYNLDKDLAERINLFWQEPEKVRELHGHLEKEVLDRDMLEDIVPQKIRKAHSN